MLYNMDFSLDYLQISQKSVSLHCVFHSIRLTKVGARRCSFFYAYTFGILKKNGIFVNHNILKNTAMKKLITLFFISILSLQMYCSAQEILNVDYSAIKEYVTDHSTEFQKLMQRFEENDSLLTRQDYAMIYYGYSFTPAYKGSMDNFQDLRKLIKEQKYEDAYNTGKELLKKNPVSLQLLYNMYGLAGLLEKDIQEIKHYSKRYAALLTMISLTGDGTSEETAFKVICVNDEYQLLNMLFRMENMKSQSLVNKCDLIEFDKCQHYEGNQMYFDISRSLDYTSKLFGK